LRENVVREADETDAAVTEETDDAVRVLTIHAAKGLEFPIVVFANMNTERPDRTNVIVTRGDGRGTLELKLGQGTNGFLTPGYAEAEREESAHSTAEQLRLLYVAATRARDHLVVPLFEIEGRPQTVKSAADAKSLNQHLRRAGAHEARTYIDAATLPLAVGEPPALRIGTSTNRDEPQDIIDAREIWQIGRSTRIEQGSARLRVHTATSLKEALEDAEFGEHEMRRGKARDFGVAVHALLERIDLARHDGTEAPAAAVAAEFGLQERADEIASCARHAISSDVVRRALASPRMLREVAFTAPLPEAKDLGLAEGRIDLLFVENGQIVLVDFKTDDVRHNKLDRRVAAYRTQALVYAWAATRTTGMPVREVVFLFVRLPAERSIPVDAAFLAEAEALLRTPALPAEA
jgi:ATP-dependent helicase/nuclease subunit A